MNKLIVDEFRAPRNRYRACKYPIVLCHGLLGFSTISVFGKQFSYFNGVKEALEAQGATVAAQSVPPIATIERRADVLHRGLVAQRVLRERKAVNILAHSMGGLDARLLVSRLLVPEDGITVATVTTLSTPHRGSPMADMFGGLTPALRLITPALGGLGELTTEYMVNRFNKDVPDKPGVDYFSYGARFTPTYLSPFYLSWRHIQRADGDNDGMVSVNSAHWGKYMGTLDNVDHGDIINMSRYKPQKLLNPNFSSQAMYLGIMDDLASMGY